jgi:hypothetical protein
MILKCSRSRRETAGFSSPLTGMPNHFGRFLTRSSSAGLLIVSQRLDIREAIDQILLVWAASEGEEWINRIGYLPL